MLIIVIGICHFDLFIFVSKLGSKIHKINIWILFFVIFLLNVVDAVFVVLRLKNGIQKRDERKNQKMNVKSIGRWAA